MGAELVIQTVARLVLVPTLLIAAAILVKGYAGVGDGFSAGVVAALGILVQYAAFGYEEAERRMPLRFVAASAPAGLVLVLAVAFGPAVFGEPIVTHFPRAGEDVVHLGTLELLTATLFDLGIFLIVVGVVTGIVSRLAHEREDAP